MNELKSYTEYAVSTPTADFVIGFDFNYGEDAVNVTVDDVPASVAGYTVVYLNETTIRLSPSVPSGVVRLQRETDIDQTDHAYRAGAKFIAQTMDENFEQLRHSQQEVRDGFVKLADDTYEIIDTLEEVGKSAQDAADAAEVAAELANNAAVQVNDKVSYEDFNNKPHNAMLDRDAASAHPTSSILDASGETQQQVNYNGGSKWHSRVGGYRENERVVLANGDIVKSTVDGNTNNPNVDMTGWVLTNDATQIKFKPSALNSAMRNVADRLEDYVSVKDFGAVGDGVADDTLALKAAVNTGRNVYLPKGVYLVSDVIQLKGGGLYANNDATIFRNQLDGHISVGNYPSIVFALEQSDFDIIGVNVRGGYISGGHTGNSTPTMGENGHGILLNQCKNVRVLNCNIINTWGDCIFVNSGGIYSSNYVSPENILVSNCNLINPLRGCVTTTHVDGLTVINNSMFKANGYANATILIEPNSNVMQTARNILVFGNRVESKTSFAVVTSAGELMGGAVKDVRVLGNSVKGITLFVGTSTNLQGVTVSDNILRPTTQLTRSQLWIDLFTLNGAKDVTISDNQLIDADGTSTAYFVPHINNCEGISVYGNTWRSKLSGSSPNDTSIGLLNRTYLTISNSKDVRVVDNIFGFRPTVDINATPVVSVAGADTDNITIRDNTFSKFAALALDIKSDVATGRVSVVDNTLDHVTTNTFVVSILANNPNIEVLRNRFLSGRVSNVYLAAGVVLPRIGATESNALVKSTYGASAPTSGTWARNSTVINTQPSNGTPLGWICVVGGSPGTWSPFGLIGINKVASQAASVATDVAALKADFNSLLEKLRAANLM